MFACLVFQIVFFCTDSNNPDVLTTSSIPSSSAASTSTSIPSSLVSSTRTSTSSSLVSSTRTSTSSSSEVSISTNIPTSSATLSNECTFWLFYYVYMLFAKRGFGQSMHCPVHTMDCLYKSWIANANHA